MNVTAAARRAILVAFVMTSACSKRDPRDTGATHAISDDRAARDECGELYDKITTAWDGNSAFIGVEGTRDEWVPRCRADFR